MSGASPQADETTVIVGTSVGGVRTAQALRAEHYSGRIVMIGQEHTRPYDKPPLSKGLLTGEANGSAPWLLRDGEANASSFDLRLGQPAVGLDLADQVVHLAEGEPVHYDNLVVATGASAKPCPWGPDTGESLHVLRTIDDSVALRRDLEASDRVAVIGAGFIGAEVASSARALGLDVILIDARSLPMAHAVGEDAGRVLADLHARNCVDTRFGVGVEGVEGGPGGFLIHLDDDSVVEAGVVVVGIGVELNDSWLRSSGVGLEDGLLCDAQGWAEGAVCVYGVGDLARWHDPRRDRRVRVEHWTNAVGQAACVAHNIAHPDDPRRYEPAEYVWTDQYGWKIQIAGRPEEGVGCTTIGPPDKPDRWAFLHEGASGGLVGAMAVNWPRGLLECRRMLGAGAAFSEAVDRMRLLGS